MHKFIFVLLPNTFRFTCVWASTRKQMNTHAMLSCCWWCDCVSVRTIGHCIFLLSWLRCCIRVVAVCIRVVVYFLLVGMDNVDGHNGQKGLKFTYKCTVWMALAVKSWGDTDPSPWWRLKSWSFTFNRMLMFMRIRSPSSSFFFCLYLFHFFLVCCWPGLGLIDLVGWWVGWYRVLVDG